MSTVVITEEKNQVTEIASQTIIVEETTNSNILEIPIPSDTISSTNEEVSFVLGQEETILSFQEPVPEVIEVGCPGPQGPAGPPGEVGNLPSSSLTIDPASSAVGDTLDLTLFSGVTWVVTARDISTNAVRMFTVSASFNGSSANHVTYGFNGASFGVPITVNYIGNTLELTINNNHTSTLQINIIKLTIGL